MVTEKCNGVAVRFEAGSTPEGVYVCHCSLCRRFTGTDRDALVSVSSDDVRWKSGEEFISN